ncbi:LysR family transcriptional regulator [Malaciobacter marinus]|uniref:LysR family transcriptional regulator n=1 Tax=Malaciobacter marinus TaxID=505249 RepID=UPI0010114859|nr:LysR substrate-binding domain-containing protein [Malaciobacter halophilus]RYA24919.1 LysR family transcriptional regulator [Malaciobacter halophilus]
MDSNLLKIFLSVANMRSFSKASIELNCAQSNVTARIKQLEKSIGYTLFHRFSKGIVLTDVGEKLYPYAKEIVQKVYETQQFIMHLKHEETLKIASTESNAATRIVTLLSKIDKKYPNMKLELSTGPSQELIDMLLDYKVDIAFVSGKPTNKEFMIIKEFKEELVLLKPLHKNAANNILTFKKGCTYKKHLDEYMKKQNKPYKNIEFGSLETIIGCVKMGMGITVLPIFVVDHLNFKNEVKIETLPNEFKNIHTYMICRKDNQPLITSYLKKLKL